MTESLHVLIAARIDELERIALAAAECEGEPEPEWTAHEGEWRGGVNSLPEVTSASASVAFCDDDPIATHIATWDPATVLRGLAEDRDILARHRPSDEVEPNSSMCIGCFAGPWINCDEIRSLARRHSIEAVPS